MFDHNGMRVVFDRLVQIVFGGLPIAAAGRDAGLGIEDQKITILSNV